MRWGSMSASASPLLRLRWTTNVSSSLTALDNNWNNSWASCCSLLITRRWLLMARTICLGRKHDRLLLGDDNRLSVYNNEVATGVEGDEWAIRFRNGWNPSVADRALWWSVIHLVKVGDIAFKITYNFFLCYLQDGIQKTWITSVDQAADIQWLRRWTQVGHRRLGIDGMKHSSLILSS